jgi:hypothetical protein
MASSRVQSHNLLWKRLVHRQPFTTLALAFLVIIYMIYSGSSFNGFGHNRVTMVIENMETQPGEEVNDIGVDLYRNDSATLKVEQDQFVKGEYSRLRYPSPS